MPCSGMTGGRGKRGGGGLEAEFTWKRETGLERGP
jgi:hypothetical protein